MNNEREQAHNFVNKAEGLLDVLYYKGKTYLGELRRTVDKVADERAGAKPQEDNSGGEWFPSIDQMLNDIADAAEAQVRPQRGNDWVSGYRSMDRSRFESDAGLANQLRIGWKTIPEAFKSKRNVSTQPGPVKNDVLNAIKDIGKQFGI